MDEIRYALVLELGNRYNNPPEVTDAAADQILRQIPPTIIAKLSAKTPAELSDWAEAYIGEIDRREWRKYRRKHRVKNN